ncbi:subtilase family serine protease [Arthrobacter silviterrae]|uniref:S8/S53 family peptidase n=1 Tax=Arthrobacter silviterrae TaxID=2026658 RepID=A0ABX0DJW1_9MICC|nr:S53 family peptidase [Arthrobacter silviterrae]MDQ0276650.1 subtilase family serine protease [Arthrobacter silviterrae]NGN84588.1 S8/S53 family peptidase [Arthrobacter silviterrae]
MAVVVTVIAAVTGAGVADAAPTPKPIPNSSPGWLTHGKNLGAASPNGQVSARVYLAPNGGLTALQSAAEAASSSHHFLTPAQYHAQFDATGATVSAVSSWLSGAGLKVKVDANHRYVDVTGNVRAADKAFGVTIANFSHDGLNVQAPTGSASAPASVASAVIAIQGLDTTVSVVEPRTQKPSPPSAGFRNAPVCSHWYGDQTPATLPTPDGTVLPQLNGASLPYAPCGYTGPQLRNAYEAGAAAGLDGRGVTVAITDAYASATIEADANKYAVQTGDQPFAAGQFSQSLPKAFTQVNSNNSPRQCDASGWYGEETLDVEAVHAMAPAANIRYYAGASCQDSDLLDTFTRINDEGIATIVTNSWGGVGDVVKPALFQAYETAFLQGAVQGISYAFSTGDSGDEAANVGSPQTDYPASDPFVTGVGGTSTAITPAGVTGETGWQTTKYTLANGAWAPTVPFQYGGGGGFSSNIPEPAYQVAAGIHSPNGGRALPDVSMDADPTTGMLVGQTQTFPGSASYDTYRIGGTSLASPLFAGMTALKIQASGHGLGLLNPAIYADPSGFHDVTGAGIDAGNIRVDFVNGLDSSNGYVYSVRSFNTTNTTLKVGTGWDSETGWGSARAGWLTPAP